MKYYWEKEIIHATLLIDMKKLVINIREIMVGIKNRSTMS